MPSIVTQKLLNLFKMKSNVRHFLISEKLWENIESPHKTQSQTTKQNG